MKSFSIPALALFALSQSTSAGTTANLEVEVLPGILGVSLPTQEVYQSVLGPIQAAPTKQKDAVQFQLKDIAVDDLNGDGAGWKLLATPSPLYNGTHSLTLSEETQFVLPQESQGTLLESPNTIVYPSGEGVQNFKVAYRLSYDVPANVSSGTYTGTVVFSVVAL